MGSVNAEYLTVPETCTPSSYCVVLDDSAMTTEATITIIENIDFVAYLPVVTGVDGNTIYFASEKDLGRFCNYISADYLQIPFNGEFSPYINGQYSPYGLLKGVWSYDLGGDYVEDHIYINTTVPETFYMMLFPNHGQFSGDDIYLNGNMIHTSHDVACTTPVFKTPTSAITNDLRLVLDGSSYVSRMTYTVVIFGNFVYDSTSSYSSIYTMIAPPELYYITFESVVNDFNVYDGDNLLGTFDDGDIIQFATGTHEITVEKDGFTYTESVVMDEDYTMQLPFRSIPLSIEYSEGGLTDVSVYKNGTFFNNYSDGDLLDVLDGTYEFTFVKSGFWNETESFTVSNITEEISVRMYPESVFFKISNTPVEITTYSNSEVNIALNIEPNDNAYGVKLYLTGQEVLDVRDSSNVQISKQDSYYLLDDLTNAKTVNVKINSGTILGTNSLAVRVTGYNSIGTEFVTDTTIDYEIVRLPLSLTVPNWCIGSNSLTVIETEGETRTVTIKVEDSDENIIYSDSYTLEGFETHKFNIDFEETGDYKLYIQSGDLINTYIDVNVANPVSLTTKTITASEGSTGTVTVSIENPFSEPQYYRLTIEGTPLVNSTKVDFSISPGSSKVQSLSFTLLDSLDYDSYSLPLKVYLVEESGLTEIYSDSVILNIGSSGSFIPFIDLDDGIIDTVITLVYDNYKIAGILIISGLGLYVVFGRKKGKKPLKTIKKPIVKKDGKKGGK